MANNLTAVYFLLYKDNSEANIRSFCDVKLYNTVESA